MTLRPADYSSSWLGLFELFEDVHAKLHISIPDTAIFRDGQILGWFYTSREGSVSRVSPQEASLEALFHRLTSGQVLDQASVSRHVAVAHFSTGISRPVDYEELRTIAFILPIQNKRYIATFASDDGGSCTVFARRFGSRPATSPEGGGASQEHEAVTPEETAVESQLVALGLLDPISAGMANGSEPVLYVPRKVKSEITHVLQEIAAFVEQAHGYRMQGMVAEFLHADSDTMFLTSILAVQWDTNYSAPVNSPRLPGAKFSDQWGEFMNGVGSPKYGAKALLTKRPPMLKSDGAPLYMTSRSGPSSPGSLPSANRAISQRLSNYKGSNGLPLSIQRDSFSPPTGLNSSGYTARNSMSTFRRGAGGNPTASPPASSSFTLWAPQSWRKSDRLASASSSFTLWAPQLEEIRPPRLGLKLVYTLGTPG
eukprot:gene31755-6953_t